MYALSANQRPVATTLPRVLRGAGRIALAGLAFTLVIATTIGLRFALYEYGHGNGALVRQLLGTAVADRNQTSR